MIIFAVVVFFLALAGILALFALKLREARNGHVYLPEWREAADHEALHLKELLSAAQLDLKKMLPLLNHAAHVALHFAALEFARAARFASQQSNRLADFVSHKHNFERRQTRSEFLKKMSERKSSNGNGSGHYEEDNVN